MWARNTRYYCWNSECFAPCPEPNELQAAVAAYEEAHREVQPLTAFNLKMNVVCKRDFAVGLPYALRSKSAAWRGEHSTVADAVEALYENEMRQMIAYAAHCGQPEIVFNGFTKSGDQYIAFFALYDREKPNDSSRINFHMQNTSQWEHAGAIVVSKNGGVSANH